MRVYHAKLSESGRMYDPAFDGERPFNAEGYDLVATVEGFGLDEAFSRTNTIDFPWWENACVVKTVDGGVRSTSVGDVIVDADGVAWRVEATGFRQVAS